MEKLKFKTSSGIEIELNENDMHVIHQHYIFLISVLLTLLAIIV